MKLTRGMRVAVAVVAGGLILTGAVYGMAQRDIRDAHAWMQNGSRVIDTSAGPIEYAEWGEGSPVLLVHGTSGGFVQGLLIAQRLGPGHRYIIPSRFGYLRTPLPADATPAAQAAAYVALLDALGVPKVVVAGASAGPLSEVELAARYPDRVAGLLLISPAAWSPDMETNTQPVNPAVANFIKDVVLKSDLSLWLMNKLARPALLGFLGVPASLAGQLTPSERDWVDQIVRTLLAVSIQQPGLLNDARNHDVRQRAALEQINVPTLIVSAADDPFNTLPGATYTAQHIAGARLVRLESGGHLLVGGHEDVWAEMGAFLAQPVAGG